MIDISRYENLLKDLTIPPRPQVVSVLFEEMSKDVPDLNRVSKVIASDPGLAGGMLKVANSPLLGLSRKATTVAQAVKLLGLQQASAIATGIAIRHSLGGGSAALEKFWNDTERVAMIGSCLARSEVMAEIGAHVARALRGLRTDEAYTYALFHDCGIPILLQRFPQYLETLRHAGDAIDTPFWKIEEAEVGTHHGAVGYFLARSWGLPHELCQAIFSHHDADAMGERGGLSRASRNLIAVGHLAEYVHAASHRGRVEGQWGQVKHQVMGHFGLDEAGLIELVDEVEAALHATELEA